MKTSRAYDMTLREAAIETTRARIIDAAAELFFARFYDDVTIAEVARTAGVSGQTVLNHYGGKEGLFGAVIDRFQGEVRSLRYSAQPGDVARAVEVLVEDYESTGDAVIRLLAVEERLPAVRETIAVGRAGHREWVEAMFGAPGITDELVVATDVYAWKLLRRDRGLSREATVASIRRIVEALLLQDNPPHRRRAR